MSSHSKSHLGRALAMLAATIVVLCAYGTPAAAQNQPAPKWEIFGGYSYLYPNATVRGVLPQGLLPLSSLLESNPRGAGTSVTYDFNRWLGLTLDASTDWGSGETTTARRIDDAAFSNLSIGPKITFRSNHFSPFIEALVGDHRLMPDAFHDIDKFGFMAGAGLDVNVSRHIALRLLRADFVYSNYRYGPPALTPDTNLRGVRLQTGLVVMFGGGEPALAANHSPVASCSVDKSMVYSRSGDFVVVSANASDSDNDPLTYTWTTSGGAVEGSGSGVRWNSSGAAEGSYTVSVRVEDGRGGATGCSSNISVAMRPNRPPTMSCTTDRTTFMAGESAHVTAAASDPDNDPLTYSWQSSGGHVSGTGDSVSFDTSVADSGKYTVTGHVDDSRGGTADCALAFQANQPPPPPEIAQLEARLSLHSIYFATDRPTVAHPEAGLVDSQQQILSTLSTDFKRYLTFRPEAHLILGGHADERGSVEYNKHLTERRVDRTKSYLVDHGVSAAAIDTRSYGKEDQLNADQIKEQIAQNPDLSASDRQEMLGNMQVMLLANNRRVDVELSTTGQQSTHRYPFNARDYLALIDTQSKKPKTTPTPTPKSTPTPKRKAVN